MYGEARGLKPPREGIFGDPVGTNYTKDDEPPLSGLFGMGNSLTIQGPATEPAGVNELEDKRMKMAMAMMGRGMTGFSKGMQQGMPMPSMAQRQALDMYGNPIGGA